MKVKRKYNILTVVFFHRKASKSIWPTGSSHHSKISLWTSLLVPRLSPQCSPLVPAMLCLWLPVKSRHFGVRLTPSRPTSSCEEETKRNEKKTGARDAHSSRFFCILTSTKCRITAANLLRLIYIWGFGAVWIQTVEPVTVRAAKRQRQPWISFLHDLPPPPSSFSHISPDSWIAVRGLPFAIWGCGTHLGNSC